MIRLEKKASQSASNSRAAEAANVRVSVRFELIGLKKYGRPIRVELHLADTVDVDRYFDFRRDAFAVDIYKTDGTFIRSIYGDTEIERERNYAQWSVNEGSRVVNVEYVQYYKAPDGFVGTLEKFYKWAEEGHLHGLIINL